MQSLGRRKNVSRCCLDTLLPGWRGNEASSSHLSGNMPRHGWRHTTRANTSPCTSQCFHLGLVCPMRSSRWSPSLRHMVSSSAVTTTHCDLSIFSLVVVNRNRVGGYIFIMGSASWRHSLSYLLLRPTLLFPSGLVKNQEFNRLN